MKVYLTVLTILPKDSYGFQSRVVGGFLNAVLCKPYIIRVQIKE